MAQVASTWGRDDPGVTLVSILREQVARDADRPILRFLGDHEHETILTYAELDRRARVIAARLQSIGAPGERALILHDPGPDYVAALYGCLYAGVVAVPAYPPRFNRRIAGLASIAADARANFALSTQRTIDRLSAGPAVPRAPSGLPGLTSLANLHWVATESIDPREADSFVAPSLSAD
jgi:acyl-CoA synthetase (AMP-forming)/AMP-acid ligase II